MSAISIEARLALLGLDVSDAEKLPLADLVGEIDRAAAVVRALERSYFDEPSNIFRLPPALSPR